MLQTVKNLPAMQETWLWSLGWEDPLGRSPGEGNSYPLQYSILGNSMDRGAWQSTVHGLAKSQRQPGNFHFYYTLSSYSQTLGWFFSYSKRAVNEVFGLFVFFFSNLFTLEKRCTSLFCSLFSCGFLVLYCSYLLKKAQKCKDSATSLNKIKLQL